MSHRRSWGSSGGRDATASPVVPREHAHNAQRRRIREDRSATRHCRCTAPCCGCFFFIVRRHECTADEKERGGKWLPNHRVNGTPKYFLVALSRWSSLFFFLREREGGREEGEEEGGRGGRTSIEHARRLHGPALRSEYTAPISVWTLNVHERARIRNANESYERENVEYAE